jgi:hypothetical protein
MTAPIAVNPNNLGAKVTSRNINMLDLAIRSWGSEWAAPDHGVYVWSNGRRYDSTDLTNTGIYNGGAV